MAKVYVDDATVEKVFQSQHGWGVRVSEQRTTREGEQRKDYFTLWFKQHPEIEEGWVISASGYLSTKVRDYESNGETRQAVDVSVNAAKVLSTVVGKPAEADPYEQSGSGF